MRPGRSGTARSRAAGGAALAALCLVTGPPVAAAQDWPLTRAERSGYLETSRYADVMEFLSALPGRHPGIHLTDFGYTEEGRRLPLLVFGDVEGADPAVVRGAAGTRILVLANIHAGEVAGKEAALMMARELAAGTRDRWADSLVVLIAPIYNADGNERVRLRNRPRQHGPHAGMGQRANARDLDLNRDNTKLESAEARALARLLRRYDPHVVLDLHTTNGTIHAYHLTYSPPLHPSTDPAVLGLLRERWLPSVTHAVREAHGWELFYYGNVPGTFGLQGERGWYTFDHRPRFTTNYVGLRNRFGILSEAYAYATFEDRVLAHLRFVAAMIDYAWSHASRVREAVERADSATGPGIDIAVRAAPVRGDSIDILLGSVDEEHHPFTGAPVYRRGDARRAERMPDYGSFEASEAVTAPSAYLVPAALAPVVELLEAHGVRMLRLEEDAAIDVSVFHVDSTKAADRAYQGHHLRETWGGWRSLRSVFPAGTWLAPVRQPLGRLLVVLLEPRSDDGFLAWNLLDEGLEPDSPLPILRVRELPERGCSACDPYR